MKIEEVVHIDISLIDDFEGHPFTVKDDESMEELARSIEENGVLNPIIVRKKESGRYEIVAGHRRKRACLLLEFKEIPVIIRELSREEAIVEMVDSNFQRENILPSEKAKAYKMKMDSIKRKAGRPRKENVSPVGARVRTDEIIAREVGESRNQIQRYIRLNNQMVDELQQVITLRQEDILTSDEFKYDSDRIPYYIKSYFCLFTKTDVGKDIPKLYTEILKKSHVTPEQRGYVPAISQLSLTKRICKDFFEGNKNCKGQIRTIYDTAYFTQQYGTGSSHDCNAYAVRNFLLKVLFFTHANESKTSRSELLEICDGISDMFIWKNSIYVNELTELFYIANAKETFLNIVDHWCGTHGILWNQSYGDVEYCGSNIVKILHLFGLTDEANKIEKIVLFKLFGYVDHKDYSLSGLLDCYKQLPLSEEKLLLHGMKLLTISDTARSIGDNRMCGEIEAEIFETAANLGIKYIASLFELKNTPNDFYNWRNSFLDVYYKKLLSEDFSDDELLALYNLVNAWISEEIESSIRHGGNQLEHLYHYNYMIIEKIKNEELQKTLISNGKSSPKVTANIDDYVVKSKDDNKFLVDEIRQNGYSQDAEQKIVATFSDLYGGQAKLLIDIGDIIDISNNRNFISNCVIQFIITRRKYGYRSAGLNELISQFYSYFSNEDWLILFHNIVDSISLTSMEDFYSINEDIETLCRCYYLGAMPDKLAELCSNKLNTHWCWITSCGLLNMEPYTLAVDANMISLEVFVKYQLEVEK